MKVDSRVGRAVALALLTTPVGSCDNSFQRDPRQLDATALGSAASDPQLRAFYQARGWQAAWDGKTQAALLEVLDKAPTHGLRRDLFIKDRLPKDRGERDAALTAAALRYGSALARGYVDPTRLGRIYTVPRPTADVAAGLASAVERGDVGGWFDSLAPQTDEYRALSEAFVRYLRLADGPEAEPIPAGKAIKPGQSDARIPAIVRSLAMIGYLPAPEAGTAPSERYAPAIVAAVRRLQTDYGAEADGVIGKATIEALNRGPGDRARQLAVTLERLRWLDRNPPATRIDVNTGGAYLDYWRDGQHRDHRRVVVGQPDWETPELGSPIFQLVAHPYWRVPDSIYKDELAGKSRAYLAAQQMEYRNGRLVQLPGPKNVLGEIKFDMRNDQLIYLHDTPAKALFAHPERHRSHGCVRVQNAVDFGLLVAGDDGILPKFQEGLMKLDETFVKMKTQVPVRLMYRTAFLEDGQVRLVEDVYRWDDEVAYGLGYLRRPPRERPKHELGVDVGP